MPLGKESLRKLEDAEPIMREFALEVARGVDEGDLAHVGVTDVTIECVFRDQPAQHAAFLKDASKIDWLPGEPPNPNSGHNNKPCRAIDMLPYPVRWTEPGYKKKVWALHCYGAGVAHRMRLDLKGISWDGPHFERQT
jgi:hypothetical protein